MTSDLYSCEERKRKALVSAGEGVAYRPTRETTEKIWSVQESVFNWPCQHVIDLLSFGGQCRTAMGAWLFVHRVLWRGGFKGSETLWDRLEALEQILQGVSKRRQRKLSHTTKGRADRTKTASYRWSPPSTR
ncbi:unnamed protein product [Lota lota]